LLVVLNKNELILSTDMDSLTAFCPNKQGFKNKETKNGDHDTVANKLGRKCRGRNGETLR
jgi:hypothetical protein